MEQEISREALERKLEQTRRLATAAGDQTTVQRLWEFADDLKRKLQWSMFRTRADRQEEAIRHRAREIWEQHGRPTGRDQEFWLRGEREILKARDPDEPEDI